MPRFTSKAIILNSFDYHESDKIVSALTERRGLINAIAKGAKRSTRRFPGTLEPFSEVVLDIFMKPGGDLLRLESASLLSANLAIREDLELYAASSVLLEVIMKNLAQIDPHPKTFAVLSRALSALDAKTKWFNIWVCSLMDILSSLGYGIDLKKVTHSEQLSLETVSFLETVSVMDSETLQRLSVSKRSKREIEICLLNFCNDISERQLKTVAFLAKLLGLNIK